MKEPECFVDVYGNKTWCVNGKRHRLDGPAIEDTDGAKLWYVDDKLHRLDGPAVEWADGYKEWWIEHKNYKTQQEHVLVVFLWMNEHEKT
jgi:hypothetical protein